MFWPRRQSDELAALRAEVRVLQDAVASIALRLEALEQRPRVALPLESAVVHRYDRVNGFPPGVT